jgi:hypothetical protein
MLTMRFQCLLIMVQGNLSKKVQSNSTLWMSKHPFCQRSRIKDSTIFKQMITRTKSKKSSKMNLLLMTMLMNSSTKLLKKKYLRNANYSNSQDHHTAYLITILPNASVPKIQAHFIPWSVLKTKSKDVSPWLLIKSAVWLKNWLWRTVGIRSLTINLIWSVTKSVSTKLNSKHSMRLWILAITGMTDFNKGLALMVFILITLTASHALTLVMLMRRVALLQKAEIS